MSDTNFQKYARVMISYSRKDTEFTKSVYDGLIAQGMSPEDIWVDWEGIPLSADWMAEITKGIQEADVFIFIISPDSLSSEVCDSEVQIAVDSNKRIVPILHREPEKGNPMHETISATNWVYMRKSDDFEATLPSLLQAINTDLSWVATHTRLQSKALEWDREERNTSFILRGDDLEAGEVFLGMSEGKEPEPTELQTEYIHFSRTEDTRIKKRTRNITIGVVTVLAAITIWGVSQMNTASAQTDYAATQAAIAGEESVARATQQAIANEESIARATQQAIADK